MLLDIVFAFSTPLLACAGHVIGGWFSGEAPAGQEPPAGQTKIAGGDADASVGTPEQPETQAGLHSCLEAFFTPEDVTWTCPNESAQPCSDAEPPATPRRGMPRRSVSFSGVQLWCACMSSMRAGLRIVMHGQAWPCTWLVPPQAATACQSGANRRTSRLPASQH